MRADLFLKKSRIIKRRALAHEVISQGRVFRNTLPIKPSTNISSGDSIEIRLPTRILKIKITDIDNKKPDLMYEIVSEIRL
jgi:ribosomal 50S subunit-recycling heat shock protein